MKFTPLAGIETCIIGYWRNIEEMKFTPLAGIETETEALVPSSIFNEIHTPSGDWNATETGYLVSDFNEIHTPSGDWNLNFFQ